ncbi:MAG: ABC transporter substrate-binding protein [Paenibacillus sp.]|uniref:Iron complex transport system substrate-binding protein n=1 Tax=Paenibacillus aquistagni TaxID=1852522 RepID=A0A1X7K1E9_9BACL|nr:ABC transporter substrate-binding protein [Paenibacillus aquistagni]MBR2568114.1 ABC transporter substrate-binding protein [Paenibacillus sp.]SMG33923.1 iron complex transport system substrate-binding protein [Paenibacillus aquistagni]
MKTWWNKSLVVVMIAALTVMLAACGGTAADNKTQDNNQAAEQTDHTTKPDSSEQSLKTTYPLTVKDATGEEFTFDKAPERIVSVSPAETESLFALGLDQEIVGVSDFDDYPQAATTKPKMGGITKPNEEAIIAANPDIVFTGISMKEDVVKKFRDLGISIFKVDPKSYDDVISNIELYGQITDRQQEAKDIVDNMKKVREDVQAAVKDAAEKKKVYVEFSPGWTVGKGEFMNELIEIAGAENIAATETGWININEENIIKSNPDVILYSAGLIDTETNKPLEELIKNRQGWDQITAVKDNHVIGVDSNLISRPGPRVADGLKEVAKAIYPDLVK